MTATYVRQLEARMRHDAVCWKAAGGSRLSWILYMLGDCDPVPSMRSARNIDILSQEVWSEPWHGPGGEPCS